MAPEALEKVGDTLRKVSHSLSDIAATVGREATEATALVRRSADQARETALIAAELETIAALVDTSVRLQAELLDQARADVEGNAEVMNALTAAADGIGAMSAQISGIATRSRLLSLNARIEAARTGDGGRGFDVVANEMTSLSQQTWDATRAIEARTVTLQGDVGSTRGLFDGTAARVDQERQITADLVDAARRQSQAASNVALLTAETVDGIEDAAAMIGRVAAAATAVDLFARQVVKAADAIRPAA